MNHGGGLGAEKCTLALRFARMLPRAGDKRQRNCELTFTEGLLGIAVHTEDDVHFNLARGRGERGSPLIFT